MVDHNYELPFPRGSTFAGGNSSLLATGDPAKIAGKIYEAPDEQHNTGRPVKLRVVQVSAAVTAARKALRFSTTTNEFGAISPGYVNEDGQVGKALDDAYTVGATIPQYDYCYVVEAGPCDVNSAAALDTSGSSSSAAGSIITWGNGGVIKAVVASTGDHVAGTLVETQAAANTAYLVDVQEGLANEY